MKIASVYFRLKVERIHHKDLKLVLLRLF